MRVRHLERRPERADCVVIGEGDIARVPVEGRFPFARVGAEAVGVLQVLKLGGGRGACERVSAERVQLGSGFEARPHLVCGRLLLEILVDERALLVRLLLDRVAAVVVGSPPAAGRRGAHVPELTPLRPCHAERRDAGRATGAPPCRLGQLELERAILTLELGESRLENGEALLD